MKFQKTAFPDCFEIFPKIFQDNRGLLIKTWHKGMFVQNGVNIDFSEELYTVSSQNVLRGLHFQNPPFSHYKMVYCIEGKILDVLLDIRRGSPTYGQSISFMLTAEDANILLIPPGIAHGYYVISPKAIVIYKTSTVHSPEHDCGVHWKSVDIWPEKNPILSERDKGLPLFTEFNSTFVYQEELCG